MAKNYNNYNYGNREQRRQQERQQRKNNISQYDVIKMDEHNYKTDAGSSKEEETYWLAYNDVDYEIDRGWVTFTEVMEIEREMENRKKQEKLERAKGLKPSNPYTPLDEFLDFKKVLMLCFAEGEYERFINNNKKISINEIKRVSDYLVNLIANGNTGAVEDQSSFRNKEK